MEYRQSFTSYVLDWFGEYVNEHYDDHDMWGPEMMEALGYAPIAKYLDEEEEETPYEFLIHLDGQEDAERIFCTFFGYKHTNNDYWKDMPDTATFLERMFKTAVGNICLEEYRFADEFISNMAFYAKRCKTPKNFFEDLFHGGVWSIAINILVHSNNCLKLYINNIDDMRRFKKKLEEDSGELIENKQEMPHDMFMCEVCYEGLARRIYDNLW